MKKILYLLLCILVFPVIVNAKEDVYINKVEKDEFYGDVVEKSEPTFDGLSVNFDLKFSTVSSYATYKVTIKNDSKEDYKINKNGTGHVGYFSYSYRFIDGDEVIKAGTTKSLLLKIEFSENIPEDKFSNGKYQEDSEFTINFSNTLVNPSTKAGVSVLIILILILSVIAFGLLFKNRKAVMVLLLVLLVPVIVSAVKELNMSIKIKVEVDRFCNYKVVTNMGSFSNTEEVTEVCMDLDNKYVLNRNTLIVGTTYVPTDHPDFGEYNNVFVTYVGNVSDFGDNDYIRVYKDDSKQELLAEINKNYFPIYNYSFGTNTFYDNTVYINSKQFDKSDGYYVEKSNPDFEVHVYSTGTSFTVETDNGPWVDKETDYSKLMTLKETVNSLNNNFDFDGVCGIAEPGLGFMGYRLQGFTNCRIYDDGKEQVCDGHIYYAIITDPCTIVLR